MTKRNTDHRQAEVPKQEAPGPAPEPTSVIAVKTEATPPSLDVILADEHESDLARRERQQRESSASRSVATPLKQETPAETVEVSATSAVATPTPADQTEAKKKEDAPAPKKKGVSLGGFADFLGAIKYLGLGKEKLSIVQNLATMLNAGLPIIDSLKALQTESKYKPIKKLLGNIIVSVEMGKPLWRAMENEHFFSPHAIALIRIGEEAGNLAENMEYLAAQQEKDQALRGKVKMAMIYPTIVMILMFVIVMGLGMFVLPNLIAVLFSLNAELPFITRMVVAFTNFFTAYGTIVAPATVGGFFLMMILAKFTSFRIVTQWMMFRIPGIGRLAGEATIARFGVILGGLMQAGVPLVESLESLVNVTPIVSYKKFYQKVLDHILLGDSFSKSFASIKGSEKILPISVQQLIITGEKSGTLSKLLLKIAEIYEKKANDTAQKLPVILEPVILLFIGGLVGTIAMAIIVPIYSVVGNVGK